MNLQTSEKHLFFYSKFTLTVINITLSQFTRIIDDAFKWYGILIMEGLFRIGMGSGGRSITSRSYTKLQVDTLYNRIDRTSLEKLDSSFRDDFNLTAHDYRQA